MVNRHKIFLAQSHAASLLPQKMDTQASRIQIIATGIQESNFTTRRQKRNGPAVSFFQFERIGIEDVLINPRSKKYADELLKKFNLENNVEKIWNAFQQERFDSLAFCFARLNYWNSPIAMPEPGYELEAWNFYLKVWRPGKPHPNIWPRSYWRAFGAIIG